MKKIMNRLILLLLTGLLAWGITGCQSDSDNEQENFSLYFLNSDESKLETETYELQKTDPDGQIEEVITALQKEPKDSDRVKLLPDKVSIDNYTLESDILTLNFNSEYEKISHRKEVLIRAGVVKVLCQLEAVSYIRFEIAGEELLDSDGNPVSLMSSETFVENSGKEINSYISATLKLYFADATGQQLVEEERYVYYSSNVPLEKVVVEQLLKGPERTDLVGTIFPDTKLLGVTVTDGTCYLNFDQNFNSNQLAWDTKIPIYSIVNSITQSSKVSRIQIAINGETNVSIDDEINLEQYFTMNSEIVKTEDTDE